MAGVTSEIFLSRKLCWPTEPKWNLCFIHILLFENSFWNAYLRPEETGQLCVDYFKFYQTLHKSSLELNEAHEIFTNTECTQESSVRTQSRLSMVDQKTILVEFNSKQFNFLFKEHNKCS